MQISVLGPVEVSVGGQPVALGAGKPRALLAMLALNAGSTVSTDRLIDGLWGEQPPATAGKLVQLYVSQLRKALATDGDGAEIVTRGRGYELRLGDGDVDARRFERLVAERAPREALALWRGAPLADLADEPFAAAEIRRLEELRLTAIELAIDADLAAGRHREVVGELEALVAEQPLRERLHAQRMLALYRSGRQAEALEAYRHGARGAVDAIGVEPGPELRRLHEAILRQDPELEPPSGEAAGCRRSCTPARRWRGARPSWTGCASTGGERTAAPAGSCCSRARAASARRAWRPSSPPRCTATARPCSTPPAPARPPPHGPRSSARARRGDRRCWSSTTSTAPDDEVRAALGRLVDGLAALPVLVVATAEDAGLTAAAGADATLTLAPLDADGVAAVARLYASRGRGGRRSAWLVAASGGVPQRIHRPAGDWARTDGRAPAGRRRRARGVRARRAAGGRGRRWRATSSSCRRRASAHDAAEGDADGVVVCPFKGLASLRRRGRASSSSGASGSSPRWSRGWPARR